MCDVGEAHFFFCVDHFSLARCRAAGAERVCTSAVFQAERAPVILSTFLPSKY